MRSLIFVVLTAANAGCAPAVVDTDSSTTDQVLLACEACCEAALAIPECQTMGLVFEECMDSFCGVYTFAPECSSQAVAAVDCLTAELVGCMVLGDTVHPSVPGDVCIETASVLNECQGW